MESTRKQRIGWYFYDWANSAFPTVVLTVFGARLIPSLAKRAAGCPIDSECVNGYVYPLGIKVAVGSYYPFLIAAPILVTAILLPLIGALADRTAHKRWLLGAAAALGAGSTIALGFVRGDNYLLGGLFFALAIIGFGASIVVNNSFLPQLAPPDKRDSVSSTGWAIGNLGGGLILAINLVVLISVGSGDPERSLQVASWAIVSAGVWWGAFSLLPLMWLPDIEPEGSLPLKGNVVTAGF